MKPTQFFAVVIFCLVSMGPFQISLYAAGKDVPLFTDSMVERYGLTRAWFNQVQIDPLRYKVLYAIEEGGTLFVVSDDAKLHAIDAETGKSLWMRTFAQKGMCYFEPSVNSRTVAVLDGLNLYIFNRKNGKQLFEARLPAAAATACELSENYVYIPLMNGRLIAFPLEDHQLVTDDETPAAKSATPAAADDDDTNSPGSLAAQRGGDAVLANIVKSFEETKRSIFAEPEAPKPEPEIVLRGPLGIPMACRSFGNVLAKPTLTTQWMTYAPNGRPQGHQEILTWVTDQGAIFVAGIEAFSQETLTLRYMIDSTAESFFLDKTRIAQHDWNKSNEIVSRPTANQSEPVAYYVDKSKDIAIPSLVVVGSRGGYVFAVRDRVGEVYWQFAANGPVVERIAVVGKDVYCPTFPTGMHALDITNGKEKWFTPGIKQFVASSKKRLYTLDANANLVILNRETGVPISSFNVRQVNQFLFNIETDRIYCVNESGLIQCLKERQLCEDPECRGIIDCPHAEALAKPIRHRLSMSQYVVALKSKTLPKLYWMSGADEEVAEETSAVPKADTDDDDGDPFGTTPKKMSDDDDEEEEEPEEDDFSDM